jgi:tetratricopeptide (TPR) repeat protein
LIVTALVLLALSPAVHAVHPKRGGKDESFPPLMDNLGDHQHKITTKDPLAQQYFNQGLRLMYGFNHAEAIRAYRAAAAIDPDCAMAQWGIALSLGPNYNLAADDQQAKDAYAAVQQAKKLAARASPKEAAYIEALALRYAETPPEDRAPLDLAYADAMRKVAQRFPDDLDAATLFAEAMMDLRPWKLWTKDGKPEPGTEEITSTLERVLQMDPRHPGANHFYIHAVEASPAPERALPCALRLAGLMPGAGHMVHMPAHIYFRLGRYRDASQSNERAIAADEAYIASYKPDGPYPMMYYPHNIHFLWAALTMEGRGAEAIRAATEVCKRVPDEMVKKMPMVEAFTPTRLFALARFGRWDEILKEKAPDPEFTYATGIWHYARGLAWAAHNQSSEAETQAARLREIASAMPEEKMAMQHRARDLLAIALDHLDATLLAQSGEVDAAAALLRKAVDQQDALQYDEPPPWYLPMRQALGAQLLKANRPADAEKAYRDDLAVYPENGWSLFGLQQSLRAQNRADEAKAVGERFEKAWPSADIDP